MSSTTVLSTPNRPRHRLAFRTPFSAHWFLFFDSSETYAENGVLSSQPLRPPTEESGEPEMSVRSVRASVGPASIELTSSSRQRVWVSDYGYDQTLHAFEKSAAKLGVAQIDLLILHQPMPQHFERS